MIIFRRIIKSIIFRLKIVSFALLLRGEYLPRFDLSVNNPEIYGWSNIFDVLPDLRQWQATEPAQCHRLYRTIENQQSTEADVARLLYDLTRLLKATCVIEVGVYRGAGSLNLVQGMADNGGGEIHLVDISAGNLEDVRLKIADLQCPVKVHLHLGDSSSIVSAENLPAADLVFLDADHLYEAIQKDIESYWPLVLPGGMLVIHDTIMWGGTRESANELSRQGHRVCTIASSGGSGVSMIRKDQA
ncbi:MAG: hypothetical protein CVU61_06815 [Deltaproteobacteria bacterium HGW-Deltaproteobacteria-19]|jgi:predicted O-methyltransferase YrrM|nr:MAG: hypothetical protein CVU61_06815 [Deltaproteobacteria bacterium HGW-Deltaproteobacteria-19]